MNINYDNPFNFKPIPSITPASDYWQNGTWKFNMPEITVSTGTTPSWQDIILSGNTALTLTNALANGLNYLKLFGGTEQRNLPSEYTQVNGVTNMAVDGVNGYINTGIVADVDDMEYDIVATVNTNDKVSWYILQSRLSSGVPIYGISGSQNGNTINCSFSGESVQSPSITRQQDHTYHVNFKCKNGNATLYVEDLTAGINETATGTYTFTATTTNTGLFSNINGGGILTIQNTSVLSAYIKKSGVKVMDYVSCTKNSNSEAGFYDKVTSTFRGATYGGMNAGSVTVPTPDTPMDIVCNNGVIRVSKNLFDYEYFYDNYQTYSTSAVGRCPIKLQPNTTYTVSTNEETSSSAARIFVVSGSAIDWTPNTYNNGVLVNRPRTVTTDSNGYLCFGLYIGSENAIPESDFINGTVWVQIEQGSTATPYMPYGQIYTDGTQETVTVTGRNLFDPSAITENKYINVSGNEASDNSYAVSDYIYVAGANTITMSTTDTGSYPFGGSACKAFYDANKNYISNTAIPNSPITATNPVTVTVPSGAVYFRTSVRKSSINKVQVEYGDIATTFEAYTVLGSATAEMLLKVGDYKDEQSVLDGSVTRNIGIKVFDGTEDWEIDASSFYLNYNFNCAPIGNNQYCTHYNYEVSQTTINLQNREFYIWSNGNRIRFRDYRFSTVQQFIAWLADQYNAGTPVIVVYPLAEPTTETVTGQPLTTQAGTNIVSITQASIDNLELEVSFKQSTI